VGEVSPKLPKIEATCTEIPILAPAVRRLSLRSRPVGAGRPLVVKVSVDVDKHCHKSTPLLSWGLPQWGDWDGDDGQPRAGSSVRASRNIQRSRLRIHETGLDLGPVILPLALLGPLAGAVGRLVFGKRIAGMSLPESVSITGAITWFGISLVLQLAAVSRSRRSSACSRRDSVGRRTTSRR